MFVSARFPRDEVLRRKWILATRRKNFNPSRSAVLCSRHFVEEDFNRTRPNYAQLKEGVIPSVFQGFPCHLQKVKKTRKSPAKREVQNVKKNMKAPAKHEVLVETEVRPTVEASLDSTINVDAANNCSNDATSMEEDKNSITSKEISHHTSKETAGIVQDSINNPPLDTESHSLSKLPKVSSVSPEKAQLKRKLSLSQSNLVSARKKIKGLQQSRRRLITRNAKLQDIISELKDKNLLSTNSLEILEDCAGGVGDLLKRQVAKNSNKPLPVSYSPELRSFALTLHFYSPHAYRYVRKTFNTCLPHPRTIGKWYQTIPGDPGFTSTAFNALQSRSVNASENDKQLLCSLVMDEVSIRQHVEWDGKKYHGYIDMGTQLDSDILPVAKNALTFMVVAVNDHWKLPVGYFLIDGLNGTERSNLVLKCLEKLDAVGVNVISMTFDGASCNVAMAKNLGCKLDPNDLKTFFLHPVTCKPIYVFLDPCHMLKLVRNTLAEKCCLVDSDNRYVKWEYIEKLHSLQQQEGLHLGNKLKNKHIEWMKNKMNVKLAAQLLSESVACSLEFCLHEKLKEFEGCEPTIKFIRFFNRLFDILNSRNLKAYEWKCPMNNKNHKKYVDFLKEAKTYIMSLKQSNTYTCLLESNRKTGFLGFLVCIDSLIGLYNTIVSSQQYGMNFLSTYKFSQDHLEQFFGKVRRLGGCNNNPTARQFKSAYKKLLVHNDVQAVLNGNTLPLQSVPILTASSNCSRDDNVDSEPPSAHSINLSIGRSKILTENAQDSAHSDHDYVYVPHPTHMSLCSQKIVAYIAGFVVFKLKQCLKCETCLNALESSNHDYIHSLVMLKSRGALIFPSDDVIDICMTCEKVFRMHAAYFVSVEEDLSRVTFNEIMRSVLETYMYKPVFETLDHHIKDFGPLENHLVFLIKAITEKYIQVRCSYAGKHYTDNLIKSKESKSRQEYTKLILFKGM